MDMKLEVKVAYSILKDRLELSLSRGWIDEEGVVMEQMVSMKRAGADMIITYFAKDICRYLDK